MKKHTPLKMKSAARRQSGQATLELTAALLALLAVILGMVFVVGLCLCNVEVFLEAKGNADEAASTADPASPGSGDEISDWRYSTYTGRNGKVALPFLGNDRSVSASMGALATFQDSMDRESASASVQSDDDAYGTYVFVPASNIPVFNPNRNFASSNMEFAVAAANLVQAKAANAESVATLSPSKSGGRFTAGEVEKLKKSFHAFFGVDLSNLDLDSVPANRVAMPKLKTLSSDSVVNFQ